MKTILDTSVSAAITMNAAAQQSIPSAPTTAYKEVMTIENKALFSATAFGWWRNDISSKQAYEYWRDIHGTLAARIPGLYQYRQLHLAKAVRVFALPATISTDLPEADQPNGIAQLLFDSQEGQHKFGTDPLVTEEIFMDEQNLVRANATLWSNGAQALTLKDALNHSAPQGEVEHPTYVVALSLKENSTDEPFHQYVKTLAQQWSQSDTVLRMRYHFMNPYDDQSWKSPNVKHEWDKHKHYRAWLEVVVKEHHTLKELPIAFVDKLNQYVSAVHTYPVVEKYTLVYKGKPTEVGLRGYPAYKLIKDIQAHNQREGKLLTAMYGKDVFIDKRGY